MLCEDLTNGAFHHVKCQLSGVFHQFVLNSRMHSREEEGRGRVKMNLCLPVILLLIIYFIYISPSKAYNILPFY